MNSALKNPEVFTMIAIASDHGGFSLKQEIMAYLSENGKEYKDFGCYTDEACDYPDFAFSVAEAVAEGDYAFGILVCGTGIGMSLAANKVKGIRAAVCADTFSAKYTKRHNNANIICLGARTTGAGLALDIIKAYMDSEFEGGKHARRIGMISEYENNA
jgi:ribose 5-phosphate isomerase B